MAQESTQTIGWVGIGRMGFPMAERLVKAGYDVRAWNRTRAKAEPLAKIGAALADNLSDLAEVDVLFSMVSTGKDLNDIYFGDGGDGGDAGGAAGPFRRGFAQGRP